MNTSNLEKTPQEIKEAMILEKEKIKEAVRMMNTKLPKKKLTNYGLEEYIDEDSLESRTIQNVEYDSFSTANFVFMGSPTLGNPSVNTKNPVNVFKLRLRKKLNENL